MAKRTWVWFPFFVMYTTLNKTPSTRVQLFTPCCVQQLSVQSPANIHKSINVYIYSELEYLQLKKNSNYPGTTFFYINAGTALCFLLLLLSMLCHPPGWELVEPIKHMIRQHFPFWRLMVNTSGGVSEVFYLQSWGSRVAWRVCYRSVIYSDISVRSKFLYIAMWIKLHGRNNWHLWICSKIAEKCKKSVLTLKKTESREGFLNTEVATRSAKDYVGLDTNCAWHKEQNEGNKSCKELWHC